MRGGRMVATRLVHSKLILQPGIDVSSKSLDLSSCSSAVILRNAWEHVSIEIADSLDYLHVTKEELKRWKELRYAVGFVFLDNLLQMAKGD